MKYQAGIINTIWPYAPKWLDLFVEATTPDGAMDLFEHNHGLYRNLTVREVKRRFLVMEKTEGMNPPSGVSGL